MFFIPVMLQKQKSFWYAYLLVKKHFFLLLML